MDKCQIDSDPEQYNEEWFNIANIEIGKEFELPNLSSTLITRWLVDNKSHIQTSPAFNIDVVARQVLATDVAAAISSCSSHSIPTNQLSVSSNPKLQSDSPNNELMLGTENYQQSHVPFPSNEQAVAHGFVNSSTKFYPNSRSNHHCSIQNPNQIIANVNQMSVLSDPLRPSSSNSFASTKNKETLVSNDQYYLIQPKQEVKDEIDLLHVDRKHNVCCLHKLTIQFNQSKSNEKMKDGENQSDFEGDYKCFVCNLSFASGNALGGHMSSHAKKRKMQVMRNGGLSIFKSDELFSGLEVEEDPLQGSENCSNQPPK